jgi:hypothetical protein
LFVDYKTFVKAVRNLPTPSPVLLRIECVLQNPDASALEIAEVTAHMIGRPIIEDEVSPEISTFALETVALSQEGFRLIAPRAIEDKKKLIHY